MASDEDLETARELANDVLADGQVKLSVPRIVAEFERVRAQEREACLEIQETLKRENDRLREELRCARAATETIEALRARGGDHG